MAEYTFDREFGDVILAREIAAAFPGKKFRTVCDGTSLVVHTEEDWTTGEQATLASVIESHNPLDHLFDSNKAQRCAEIDQKSNELIALGFEYDGETFSLSANSQMKVLGLRTAIMAGVLVDPDNYPIPYACLNETTRMITGEADMIGMFNTGFSRMQTILATGAAIKGQCMAAEDQAALDAIIDNRT